jgi:hypothetical protein
MSKEQRGRAGGSDAARSSIRNRSRERDAPQSPRRQLRSTTRAAAAIQAAYGDNPQSISRLRDDELSCVLPFLSLRDLAQLVRCSHRFNGVARKESSRRRYLEGEATIVPRPSSSLIHHVTSIRLHRRDKSRVFISRQTLRQLKDCPRLTALRLVLDGVEDAAALLQRQTPAQLVQALKAGLPTQLTSLHVSFSRETIVTLGVPFCAALPVLSQLTELWIQHGNEPLDLPPGVLRALPHLRKLRAGYINWNPQLLAEVKQLSQLRELNVFNLQPHDIVALCQPPHVFHLECIAASMASLDEVCMRALSQLPLLTSLEPQLLEEDVIPLLPQLKQLRRLLVDMDDEMPSELVLSLSTALAGCHALTDLSLQAWFDDNMTDQEQREHWTNILRAIPNVRRLHVEHPSLTLPLSILHSHVPLLENLSLQCHGTNPLVFLAQLAHPSVRHIHLRTRATELPGDAVQLRALVHSARLPMLDCIVWRAPAAGL